MSRLDEILRDYKKGSWMKRAIKTLILSKNWYYYDPDELGEDAFKPLTEDELEEL